MNEIPDNHKCQCENDTFRIKMHQDIPCDWLICAECGHIQICDYYPMEKTIKKKTINKKEVKDAIEDIVGNGVANLEEIDITADNIFKLFMDFYSTQGEIK